MTEKIPSSIVKAILTVQAAVAAVARDGKNQHGGYAYASIDAVYAMTCHKMAEAGLSILTLEDGPPEITKVEKDGKVTQWGRWTYSFVLATEQDTWTDPGMKRTIMAPITGPQTFMATQSYVDKTFQKSLFKIPTGDKFELDGLPQDDPEQERPRRDSSAEGKRNRGDIKKFNELRAALEKAPGAIDCQRLWDDNKDFLARIARGWYETLSEAYVMRLKDFGVDVEAIDQHALENAA